MLAYIPYMDPMGYKHKIDGIRLGIVYCWVYHTTQQTGQGELMGNLQS